MRATVFTLTTASILLLSQSLHAIHRGENDLPYSQPMSHPLDQPLNDKYEGKCFFMNLGPTGIRARLDPEAPTQFKVMYVFQDAKSPAKGKISIGDMIIGANGKSFNTPHGFHRKQNGSRGWAGPPFDLALAIEDSQGRDGKLDLTVLPGGKKSGKMVVSLQLEPVGRFSDTYPWNCPRSEKLLTELCDFLIDNGIKGRHHYQIQQLLALWAADDKRVMPLVKAKAESLMKSPVSYKATGMCTWGWGYSGIFLGEYYNMTKDKGVMPAVEALVKAYEVGQDWGSGGYSHRPFPAIEQRVAGGGPKGYGSMAGPGGLAMLAQSTFKASGLPYSERAYNRTHLAYLQTAGGNAKASIAYGFKGWPSLLIRLRDPLSACVNKEGIGYICPTGMKDIGRFEAEEWTQSNGTWNMKLVSSKNYPWLVTEADKLSVFKVSRYVSDKSEQRSVVRPVDLPEPTGPYKTEPGGGGHCAPMGMGAVAHFVGNKDNTSWNYLGKHLAAGCALSPGMLFDGHADATMHAFFSVIGAARADEKQFRSYLDYVKTLLVLSETHDGQGLVEQPFGCQRNATCSIARDRTAYTHVAIMLLSIPKRNLLITGADDAQPAAPTTASLSPATGNRWTTPAVAPTPVLRQPRMLSSENHAKLDRALLKTLVQLSDSGELKPLPLQLSKTRMAVWLSTAASDGTLTFQIAGGGRTADFKWEELAAADHATLSLLVATLKDSSSDALAMAGVYMESVGRVDDADAYFERSGESAKAKFEQLFE